MAIRADQFTTLSSVALLIAKILDSQGHDSRAIFRRAGLDPDKVHEAGARYPTTGMQQLWTYAVEATQDPCFGLRVVVFSHPTTANALGYAWLASQSLLDALERTARFARVVSTAAEVSLEETAEEYRYSLRSLVQVRDETIDAWLADVVKACRMSSGRGFAPLRVTMQRPKPPAPYAALMARYFRAPIDYEAPQNALFFDKAALTKRLPTGNSELERMSHQALLDYLAEARSVRYCPSDQSQVGEALPAGRATPAGVARCLKLSARTLQRKLNEAGTTFSAVLEDTRLEMSQRYLKQPDLEINEIAYLLGFAEAGNFARAFRRWVGSSPSDYRTQRALAARGAGY